MASTKHGPSLAASTSVLPATARLDKMASNSNRDSFSSTTSSYSSRSGSRRTPSRLSIVPPDPLPFLPSTYRPPSSLSQHRIDVSSTSSVDQLTRRQGSDETGGGADEWEDAEEDGADVQDDGAGLGNPPQSARSRNGTICHSASGSNTTPRRPTPPTAPTTPALLPPASSSPHPTATSPIYHLDDAEAFVSSFPSAREGSESNGLGIGLGEPFTGGRWQRDVQQSRHAPAGGDRMQDEGDVPGEEAVAEHSPADEDVIDAEGGAGSHGEAVPFPVAISCSSPSPREQLDADYASRPNLPELASADSVSRSPTPPRSERSLRPSIASGSSSDLSLPSAETVDSVDLAHSTRPAGTFVSVASGPMARLAVENVPGRAQAPRGPRAFLSNLLSRSPRSNGTSPLLPSSPPSPSTSPRIGGPPRSPSAPTGWQHPAVTAAQRSTSTNHARSSSLPSSPTTSTSETSLATGARPEAETSPRRTPRSIAAATFSGLTRSASLRMPSSPPTLPSSPPRVSAARQPSPVPSPSVRMALNSPVPTIGFATPPQPAHDAPPPPPVQTLGSAGLAVVPLTTAMSLSRNAQPLCGALLDDKYLLIGTTGGLDFLPLPLPGSLPMRTHGKKRKETRKPISLIKRTRFKDLAVLSERSNILLAIAGRNDHIRVYALDGIRAMIQKKMQELDARDGYPFIQDGALLKTPRPIDPKGKARAESQASPSRTPQPRPPPPPSFASSSGPAGAYQFPAASPPPDYTFSAPSPRRRPSSFHQSSLVAPSSPIRPGNPRGQGSFVTAVPTNPRGSLSSQGGMGPPLGSPKSVRGQKSRDFVASRRGSTTAIVPRRKSKADISATSPTSGSRRSSLASMSNSVATEPPPPLPTALGGQNGTFLGVAGPSNSRAATEGASATSGGESGWMSDFTISPILPSAALAGSSSTSSTSLTTPPQEDDPTSQSEVTKAPELQQTSREGGAPKTPTAAMSGLGLGGVLYDERYTLAPAVNRPIARQATSPRLRQGEDSPMLELADLIRNSGPDTILPSSDDSSDDLAKDKKPEPRQAASPKLKQEEMSPSMELAALMRETGRSASTSTSNLLSSGHLTTSTSTSTINASLRRSPTVASVDSNAPLRSASRAANPFPARPSSAGSGASRIRDRSSVIPKSSSQNSLGAPADAGVSRRVSQRLVARKPTTVASPDINSSDDEAEDQGHVPRRRREPQMTLDEVIRDGPPVEFTRSTTLSSTLAGPSGGIVHSTSSSSIHSTASGGGSPNNRSSKRWTMGGMGSKLLSRPGGDGGLASSHTQERRSMDTRSSSRDVVDRPARRREASAPSSTAPSQPATRPFQPSDLPPSAPIVPADFKRKGSQATTNEQPQLPAASQLPPDSHPANSNSPLEYVKLARTKGARLLRAVETKKRTYLAVLCGDEGERIELFTGSRSISLSLNRTFVLPENPRTIEFQLQGDDLVDIYLVYAESIFALEPATVRVREVGVGRGERRARRERERRMRDIATTSATPPGGASPNPDVSSSLLHPADPARQESTSPQPATPNDDTIDIGLLADGIAGVSTSRSPSPAREAQSTDEDGVTPPPVPPRTPTSYRPPPPAAAPSSSSDQPGEAAPPVPPRNKPSLPYSTFQQLPFVPPVPSSVLSSAWIIPPLYTDVVGGDSPELSSPSASPDLGANSFEHPSITVTGDGGAGRDAFVQRPMGDSSNLPLLSPISLLGGAAHRANGPPGLFFVSKGKNLSGIVTAEGKSIIKRPLVWSLDKTGENETSDVTQRLEMLIVGGTKTVVVGIGSSDVKAIAVGGEAGQPPFGAAIPVTAVPTKTNDMLLTREVQWLGTHAGSSQLFFAERVGQQVTIHCLFAKV